MGTGVLSCKFISFLPNAIGIEAERKEFPQKTGIFFEARDGIFLYVTKPCMYYYISL